MTNGCCYDIQARDQCSLALQTFLIPLIAAAALMSSLCVCVCAVRLILFYDRIRYLTLLTLMQTRRSSNCRVKSSRRSSAFDYDSLLIPACGWRLVTNLCCLAIEI